MKLRPLGTRVVVDPIEPENTTSGGIVLPDRSKEAPVTGIVIAVGPGQFVVDKDDYLCLEVEVGDKVVFRHDAGISHRVGPGKSVRIMNEGEILAVEEEEPEFLF